MSVREEERERGRGRERERERERRGEGRIGIDHSRSMAITLFSCDIVLHHYFSCYNFVHFCIFSCCTAHIVLQSFRVLLSFLHSFCVVIFKLFLC